MKDSAPSPRRLQYLRDYRRRKRSIRLWQVCLLAGLFALCGILKKSPRAWRDGGWRDILGLTVFGFLCILLVVGPLLDTSTFFMAGFSASSPLAIYLAGVPVNCVHGSAVALTMLLFGKPLLDRLRRIQIKYGMMEP